MGNKILTWQEVETLEELAQEAKAQLSMIKDLADIEEWLENETITQWLEEELRLVLKAIIKVSKRSL